MRGRPDAAEPSDAAWSAVAPDDMVHQVNADLTAFIAKDRATWAEVVRATGTKPGNQGPTIARGSIAGLHA
ncbi:MAG: hypothetical protein EBY18_17035 [Alphaproteobacteria bacterium]|nr:hypothetical protein [Alphaproteobacteria bacterium]